MENQKMFSAKQNQLFETKSKTATAKVSTSVNPIENPFVLSGMGKAAQTRSDNGALKYKTSGMSVGSLFVDQFGALARYKSPRPFAEIQNDMAKLWAVDQENSVKFIAYLRLITRQASFADGSKTKTTQRGAGLKHEGITRMVWLAVNSPETCSWFME